MFIPFVFLREYIPGQSQVLLDEDTSKHVIRVLRMQPGGQLVLTDGRGTLLTGKILSVGKKICTVQVAGSRRIERDRRKITLAVSLLKNAARFEWLLEKLTELGITQLIPLICERTEKQSFRMERMQAIMASAMTQSQQAWMPEITLPQHLDRAMESFSQQQRFICHCMEETKPALSDLVNSHLQSQIVLIGPEGDFTSEEVQIALQKQFVPVSLGPTRLRSETAALVAATLLRFG